MEKDELFKKIREGDEEEAKIIFDTLMDGTLRGAIVAIMARNFSHSIGSKILKLFKKGKK